MSVWTNQAGMDFLTLIHQTFISAVIQLISVGYFAGNLAVGPNVLSPMPWYSIILSGMLLPPVITRVSADTTDLPMDE